MKAYVLETFVGEYCTLDQVSNYELEIGNVKWVLDATLFKTKEEAEKTLNDIKDGCESFEFILTWDSDIPVKVTEIEYIFNE